MDDSQVLTSLSNPLVKKIRALTNRKTRTESDLFMVEGLHHIGSALEAGWDVNTLLFAPDLLTGDFAVSLLDEARRIGLDPQPVSTKVMGSLAGKDNPQGILAVVRQRNSGFEDLHKIQSSVALVSPQDPGNLGTILRTVDAVDADAIFLLDGGVDLYHPTCVRASMGALFWKPVVRTSFSDFVQWSKENKLHLIGTSAHGQNDFWDVKPEGFPWALLLGSEQKGLSVEQIAACDLIVSLPMQGRVSSLNLSVAAGILLYAFQKK